MKSETGGRTLLLFLMGISLSAAASARKLRAGPTSSFKTVRQAILEAFAGDTVGVEHGIYEGILVLGKPLVLEGAGAPTLRGSGEGSVIAVVAGSCTIRGFVIEHSGGMLVDEDSGILLKSTGNTLERSELRDILFGIYLYGANDNLIRANVIEGRESLDIGERGSGIHIWNALRNTIVGNAIRQARDGLYLQKASQSAIRANHISNLRYGLHCMFSDDNVFEGNVFDHNVAGDCGLERIRPFPAHEAGADGSPNA